ncbi:hypothetical protein [Goodfellowiella coeruleoviolacea]|uniref:hypothetical protein n=1 Tax=Goodfellowiella coeruleoviolacea TaxID=334858 RepID=UPI0020A433F7|nr:hypothetical protein [Goodfellowiella coeruleoviolacea]
MAVRLRRSAREGDNNEGEPAAANAAGLDSPAPQADQVAPEPPAVDRTGAGQAVPTEVDPANPANPAEPIAPAEPVLPAVPVAPAEPVSTDQPVPPAAAPGSGTLVAPVPSTATAVTPVPTFPPAPAPAPMPAPPPAWDPAAPISPTGAPATAVQAAKPPKPAKPAKPAKRVSRPSRWALLVLGIGLATVAAAIAVVWRLPDVLAPQAASTDSGAKVEATVTSSAPCNQANARDGVELKVNDRTLNAQLDGCGHSQGEIVEVQVPTRTDGEIVVSVSGVTPGGSGLLRPLTVLLFFLSALAGAVYAFLVRWRPGRASARRTTPRTPKPPRTPKAPRKRGKKDQQPATPLAPAAG